MQALTVTQLFVKTPSTQKIAITLLALTSLQPPILIFSPRLLGCAFLQLGCF